MRSIKELVYLLLISFIISYTVRPLQIKIMRAGFNKRLSSILIIGIIFVFLITCIVFFIPSILKESENFNNKIIELQIIVEDIYKRLKPLSENKIMSTVINNISEKINHNVIVFMEEIIDSTLNLGSSLILIAVIPIITYYFLVDGTYIYHKAINLFPVKWRRVIKKTGEDIDKVMGKYIASQLLLSLIIGILTFIVLLIYKIQFPIILSILNGFFNIIPYFGPIFGAIPCILIALINSPGDALWVALWVYIIQQIEGNVLQPKITGESVSMHPVTVIILLFIGGNLGGFLGMVLAIPVGVVIKLIYEDINYYIF